MISQLDAVWPIVVQNTIIGSILIVVVLATRIGLRRYISPQWLHICWVVVGLQLVTPWPVAGMVFQVVQRFSTSGKSVTDATQHLQPLIADSGITAASTLLNFTEVALSRPNITPWVWVSGMLLVVGYLACSTVLINRRLRSARRVSDPGELALLSECEDTLKLGRSVHLLEVDDLPGPAIMGLLRPTIVFPRGVRERLAASEYRWVILHELSHLKRRDLLVQGLFLVAIILHWYNPLVWLACWAASADREAACDRFAVRSASTLEAHSYGETLLKVLGMLRPRAALPMALGILENKTELKHRLEMIMKNQSIGFKQVVSTALLAVAMASAFALSAYAQGNLPKSTKAPEGWFRNGSHPTKYEVGVDRTQPLRKPASAYVKSIEKVDSGFGGMMQTCSANDYLGKRVKVSAWMKCASVKGTANLWFRVDGKDNEALGFDNMNGRALSGDTNWKECSIVLDVPEAATGLAYGIFIAGEGQAWMNDFQIQEVDQSVAVTPSIGINGPRNLEFH